MLFVLAVACLSSQPAEAQTTTCLYYLIRPTDTAATIVGIYPGLSLALIQTYNPSINFNVANLTATYSSPLYVCIPFSIFSGGSVTSVTSASSTYPTPLATFPTSFTNCTNIATVLPTDVNCNAIVSRLQVSLFVLNYCNGVPFCFNLATGLTIKY